MTSPFTPRTANYVSFLLRAWRGTDDRGQTVWRFALVAPADGSTRLLNNSHELLQFLDTELTPPAQPPESASLPKPISSQ